MSLTIKWPTPSGQTVSLTPRVVSAGIDFGYGDPFSMHVGAKVGPVWLIIDEIYKPSLSNIDIMHAVRGWHQKYGIERFWADPEDPKTIAYLHGFSLPVIPNQIKDLDYGLRTVYGLLKRTIPHPLLGEGPCLRINRTTCPNLIAEFGRYAWPQRRGEPIPGKPVDRHNHALDDLRYMLVGEGEVPPEDTRVPLVEQARMYLNEQGQWVDNPRATMAQAASAQVLGDEPWWDEGVGVSRGRFVDE